MRYLIREIYYLLIKIFIEIRYKHVKLDYSTKINKNAIFEGFNKIGHHSYFSGSIGRGSYIGEESHIVGQIGRYCSIGGHVTCLCLTHPTHTFVSTSPCFYSKKNQNGMTYVNTQKFEERVTIAGSDQPIIIGNDVYIGYGATLIAPITIGDGAIIAAQSVVTHDVKPYTIVGGNPAKVIRNRFSEDKIDYLMQHQWWNKDQEWIRENADRFESIDLFMENAE